MWVQIPPIHPILVSDLKFRDGAVSERRLHFPVEEDDDGSSPFGPAILYFQDGRLAETDQRRHEEPKSLVRYQERPPILIQEIKPMFALKSPVDFTSQAM